MVDSINAVGFSFCHGGGRSLMTYTEGVASKFCNETLGVGCPKIWGTSQEHGRSIQFSARGNFKEGGVSQSSDMTRRGKVL